MRDYVYIEHLCAYNVESRHLRLILDDLQSLADRCQEKSKKKPKIMTFDFE